jgi:predicted nucleic acid-binding protein
MRDSLLNCVTDSNVWISLRAGDLIREALSLPFNWLVPDVMLEEELRDPSGAELEKQGVKRCKLTGEQVRKVVELAKRYIRASRVDLFALVQAKEEGAVLLTEDQSLREAAEAEGLEVHGTLWLLDQMVNEGQINKRQAVESLRKMLSSGRRFPKIEVECRLRSWDE